MPEGRPQVTVRAAVVGDLLGIEQVGAITWPATYLHFAGADYVRDNLKAYWTQEALHRSLRDSLMMLVADLDDQVIGVVEVGMFQDLPTMWKLYVIPEHHGQGVGSALLRAVVDAIPEAPALTTEYTAGNEPTRRWYEARGFQETHRDVQPSGLDVVWMRLDLSATPGAQAPGAMDKSD